MSTRPRAGGHRTPFSLLLWNRWLAQLNEPAPNHRYLLIGIAYFRKALADKEARR